MRKFNVTVNGTAYEVEIEEVSADAVAVPAAPVAAPAAPKAAPAKKAAPVGNAGAVKVTSPMPGNILKMNVAVGQQVKKGDVICVLEAMKMENEIQAPCDGVVSGLAVTNGATVEAGTAICFVN